MKSILDSSFRYTNSADTDIRKTFARIRREQKKQQERAIAQKKKDANVVPISSEKTSGGR